MPLVELDETRLFNLGSKSPPFLFLLKYYPYQVTLQGFKIGTILRVKGAMVTKLCQTIKDKLGLSQTNPTHKKQILCLSLPTLIPIPQRQLPSILLSIFLMFTSVFPNNRFPLLFLIFPFYTLSIDFLPWKMRNDLFYTLHSHTISCPSFPT